MSNYFISNFSVKIITFWKTSEFSIPKELYNHHCISSRSNFKTFPNTKKDFVPTPLQGNHNFVFFCLVPISILSFLVSLYQWIHTIFLFYVWLLSLSINAFEILKINLFLLFKYFQKLIFKNSESKNSYNLLYMQFICKFKIIYNIFKDSAYLFFSLIMCLYVLILNWKALDRSILENNIL